MVERVYHVRGRWQRPAHGVALADGRLSLADGIACLREYNDEEALIFPSCRTAGRWSGLDSVRVQPGDSDEERCGRNLIALVQADLQHAPSLAAAVLGRLERELRAHLRKKGRAPVSKRLAPGPRESGPVSWPGPSSRSE